MKPSRDLSHTKPSAKPAEKEHVGSFEELLSSDFPDGTIMRIHTPIPGQPDYVSEPVVLRKKKR